jgi:hypothetical protein
MGNHRPDLVRRILLDEMTAAHGHFRLVGPGAAKLALRAGEDRAGLRLMGALLKTI